MLQVIVGENVCVARKVGVEFLATVLHYETRMIQRMNRCEPAMFIVEPSQKFRILSSAEHNDANAEHFAKVPFILRADENAVLEMSRRRREGRTDRFTKA